MRKLNITVMGKTYEVLVEDLGNVTPQEARPVEHTGRPSYTAPAQESVPATGMPAAKDIQVTSPMAGTVREINTSVGAAVQRGEQLFVLSAMDIDNTIPAPESGIVKQISVQPGETVEAGTVLLTLC